MPSYGTDAPKNVLLVQMSCAFDFNFVERWQTLLGVCPDAKCSQDLAKARNSRWLSETANYAANKEKRKKKTEHKLQQKLNLEMIIYQPGMF